MRVTIWKDEHNAEISKNNERKREINCMIALQNKFTSDHRNTFGSCTKSFIAGLPLPSPTVPATLHRGENSWEANYTIGPNKAETVTHFKENGAKEEVE